MGNNNYCVMCGRPLPADQGSKTCSMCYGDIDHGKDGYYREWAEQQEREADREMFGDEPERFGLENIGNK